MSTATETKTYQEFDAVVARMKGAKVMNEPASPNKPPIMAYDAVLPSP